MEQQYLALSLDDFSEKIHRYLSENQDGGAGHYAVYEINEAPAINKAIVARNIADILVPFIEERLYESDSYGYHK